MIIIMGLCFRNILTIIVFVVVLVGCKSSKKATETTSNQQKPQVVVPAPQKPKGVVREPNYTTANWSSVDAEITMNGKTLKSKASVRMIRDSLIVISIMPVFGIEVARLECTPNELMIINKVQARYLQIKSSELMTKGRDLGPIVGMGLDFSDIQGLLQERLFLAGESEKIGGKSVEHRLKSVKTAVGWQLTGDKNAKGFIHQFDIDKSGRIATTIVEYGRGQRNAMKMRCTYGGWERLDGISIPMTERLTVTQAGKIVGALSMVIKAAELNKPIKLNKIDLKKMTKVATAEELIKK